MKEELFNKTLEHAGYITNKSFFTRHLHLFNIILIVVIVFCLVILSLYLLTLENGTINGVYGILMVWTCFAICSFICYSNNAKRNKLIMYLRNNKEEIFEIKDTSINDVFIKYNLDKIDSDEFKYTLENKYGIGKDDIK